MTVTHSPDFQTKSAAKWDVAFISEGWNLASIHSPKVRNVQDSTRELEYISVWYVWWYRQPTGHIKVMHTENE